MTERIIAYSAMAGNPPPSPPPYNPSRIRPPRRPVRILRLLHAPAALENCYTLSASNPR
jgi:hypothetical protein